MFFKIKYLNSDFLFLCYVTCRPDPALTTARITASSMLHMRYFVALSSPDYRVAANSVESALGGGYSR